MDSEVKMNERGSDVNELDVGHERPAVGMISRLQRRLELREILLVLVRIPLFEARWSVLIDASYAEVYLPASVRAIDHSTSRRSSYCAQ